MNKLLVLLSVLGCTTPTRSSLPSNTVAATGPTLQVTATTTRLSDTNVIHWPNVVDDRSHADDVINRALDFETITGEKLADVQARWAPGAQDMPMGVLSADFTVAANQRGVLSIVIEFETLGAYPQTNHAYLNFDAASGAPVTIGQLLDPASLPALAQRLDTVLQARIAKSQQEHTAEVQAGEIEAGLWDNLHVTVESLESFTTTPTGIAFHWDADFPHVMQALAPDGELPVAFADLRINPRGPWASVR